MENNQIDPTQQIKPGMPTIWVILISVLVTGCLVGGLTYVLANNKTTKYKSDLQAKVDDANQQVKDLTAQVAENSKATSTPSVSPTPTPTTAPTTANSWKSYSNTTYKFTLQLPDSWKGFTTKEVKTSGSSLATIYFSLPTSDKSWPASSDSAAGSASLFALSVYTPTGWAKDQADAQADGIDPRTPLAQTANFVYIWDGAQDFPTDLRGIASSTVSNIIATFKTTN